MKNQTINGIKILKKGIKTKSGQYIPCWFSIGERLEKNQNGTYIAAVIYSKNYNSLPAELLPQNESDSMTDYFEKDKAVFREGTEGFKAISELLAA